MEKRGSSHSTCATAARVMQVNMDSSSSAGAINQPQPAAAAVIVSAPGNLLMELRRSSAAERWGFRWDAEELATRGACILEEVEQSSLAAAWNKAHPSQELRPGAMLVKVNGSGGGPEQMTTALSGNAVACEFQPPEQMIKEAEASPPSAASAPGFRTVQLQRSSAAERWGFVWDAQAVEKRSLRVLEKISPGSLTAEWNKTHPSLEVRPGDTLLSVNGKSGRMELMTVELTRNRIVCEFQLGKSLDNGSGISAPIAPWNGGTTRSNSKPSGSGASARVAPANSGSTCSSSKLVGGGGGHAATSAATGSGGRGGATGAAGSVSGGGPSEVQAIAARSGDTHTMELHRSTPTERWGFVWDAQVLEKQNLRMVEKISPTSPAAAWNSANPLMQVQPGDTLVTVNGKGGRLELMTVELSRNHIVCEFQAAGRGSKGRSSMPKAG